VRNQGWLGLSLAAWVAVWAFWLTLTRGFHPTLGLALIVTTSLTLAYAAAAYVHHLVLLPRLWRAGRRGAYALGLVLVMIVLNTAALGVIRTSYAQLWGPDPDPLGTIRHFGIDLFGMAVHLILALGVVNATGWIQRRT
jgi:hypothetical protein